MVNASLASKTYISAALGNFCIIRRLMILQP